MTITERQLLERSKLVYASDVSKIIGVSKYGNARTVYLEKTGQLVPQEETKPMRFGNALEPVALMFAEERLGKLRRNVHRVLRESWMGAHTDAVIVSGGAPVEGKSDGDGCVSGDWGPEGTDQVPMDALVQVYAEAICCKSDVGFIAAILGGLAFDFRLYEIPIRRDIAEGLQEKSVEFMEKFLLRGIEPPDCSLPLDVAKRLRRVPSKVVDLPPGLIFAWRMEAAAETEAGKRKDAAKAAILGHMGDAEAGVDPETGEAVTYFVESKKEHMVRASSGPVLRHKKKGLPS